MEKDGDRRSMEATIATSATTAMDTSSSSPFKPRLRLRLTEELMEKTPQKQQHQQQQQPQQPPPILLTPSPSPRTPSAGASTTTTTTTTPSGASDTLTTPKKKSPSIASASLLPSPISPTQSTTATFYITPVQMPDDRSVPPTVVAPAATTFTSPKVTRSKEKHNNGCIMWVHLQPSICTEWEQNSMVLTPDSQVGARVTTTTTSPRSTVVSSSSLTPTNRCSSGGGVSSILQALTGSDNRHLLHSQSSQKKPKTIHRCILQRGGKGKGHSSKLRCHLCDAAYDSYSLYFTHLIDTTCAKRKEAKELAARTAAAAVSTATNATVTAPPVRRGRPPGSVNLPKQYRLSHKSSHSAEVLTHEVQILEKTPTSLVSPEMARVAVQGRRFVGERPPADEFVEAKRARLNHARTRFDFSQSVVKSTVADLDNSVPLNLSKSKEKYVTCQHVEAVSLPPVPLTEHAKDRARLEEVNVRAMELLAALLGEARLAEMGYPERATASSLMARVLADARSPTTCATSDCGGTECVEAAATVEASEALRKQLSFRRIKRELAAAEANMLALRRICLLPDMDEAMVQDRPPQ